MNNETLTEHLFDVTDRLGKIESLGSQILAQATKTNGRTSKNEEEIYEIKKLISRHNGDLERNQDEFRIVRENHEAMKGVFETERDRVVGALNEAIAKWQVERDAAYADERRAREEKEKEWRRFVMRLVVAIISVLGSLILAKLGIDVAEVQKLTVPLQ